MGEVRLEWTGDRLQFVGHTAYGEPVLIGGNAAGRGAKPSDLLPISLAACTAYDVVEILRKQRQRLLGLAVVITSEQDPEPPWTFRAIHMRFLLTGTVEEQKATRAVDLAESKYCAVAATIRSVVRLSHDVEIREAS
jgi:putative redox protein